MLKEKLQNFYSKMSLQTQMTEKKISLKNCDKE